MRLVRRLAVLVFCIRICSAEDTAADDIGIHQMSRIADLLTSVECETLHTKITNPEKDIMEEIDSMLEENDNLFKTRKRREITDFKDCKEILIDWLRKDGDSMYWDRLSRALRQIGREDIDKEISKPYMTNRPKVSIVNSLPNFDIFQNHRLYNQERQGNRCIRTPSYKEMRKNMNQDKTLEVNKNIEEYGKTLEHAHSSLIVTDDETKIKDRNRGKRSEFLELNWDELELIVEMEKLPPYPRKLTEGFRTVLWGVIFGFVGSSFLGAISLYFIMRITERDCIEMMRRSNVLHRIRHRRKPVKHVVYSSDDESVCVKKMSKHVKHYFPPFCTVNYHREISSSKMSTN